MRNVIKRSRKRLADGKATLPLFNPRKDTEWGNFQSTFYGTRKHLGLQEDPFAASGCCREGDAPSDHLLWSKIRILLREPLLEFWGVFILVLFGDSCNAQVYLSSMEYGSYVNVCFGWAAGMMFGIYVAGDSGAYLNPAVTLTNCIFRGVPLRRFPTYFAAQFFGGLAAAAVVYGQYLPAIDYYEGPGIRTVPPARTSSARVFASFPAEFVPSGSQFVSELIGNFATTFCIFALRDENGADLKGGGGVFTMALFFLNFALISCFGWQTGSPINPGRDISGRIFLSMAGYGKEVWTTERYYFWVPTFVPFIACVFGAWMYDTFIYTGPSPVNTPGLGLGQLWWTIRGRNGKEKDEEGGPEDQQDKDDFSEADGAVTKDWEHQKERPENGKEEECEEKEEGLKGKDESWDSPKENSKRHEKSKRQEDTRSQHSGETDTSEQSESRRDSEGKEKKDGEGLEGATRKDTNWDGGPGGQKGGRTEDSGEEENSPSDSNEEKTETKKEDKQGGQSNDSCYNICD